MTNLIVTWKLPCGVMDDRVFQCTTWKMHVGHFVTIVTDDKICFVVPLSAFSSIEAVEVVK